MKLALNILFFLIGSFSQIANSQINDSEFVTHTINPKRQTLKFYLKDKNGINYTNHQKLKTELDKKNIKLIFATNGGMYLKDRSPQGLYIENGITLKPIDKKEEGYGNFYLKPNGVFYLTKQNLAVILKTSDFKSNPNITYATQSGPMLVIDNKIHPAFSKKSKHLHIRNGVGILPNGNILFAISKKTISLYNFANFFKSKGCKNALYLDGFVSRTYLPSKNWIQTDGDFGVIIAETSKP